MTQAGNLAAVAPPSAASPPAPTAQRFQFTVPESERILPGDPRVVVLKQTTLAEEKKATESSQAMKQPFEYELLKHALVSADGVLITWADAGKERFIEGCNPKVRSLMIQALSRVNTPSDKGTEDFFASMTAVA